MSEGIDNPVANLPSNDLIGVQIISKLWFDLLIDLILIIQLYYTANGKAQFYSIADGSVSALFTPNGQIAVLTFAEQREYSNTHQIAASPPPYTNAPSAPGSALHY